MSVWTVLAPILALILGAPIGGLLKGIDRKISARMQGRVGPPILQPFYDFFKLWGKETIVANKAQLIFVWLYFLLVVAALVLLFMGQDLLMTLFVLGFGGVCLVAGAFSVRSPYSQFGGYRELLQILAYEPILLLTAVAIYLRIGTFQVSSILASGQPLLPYLPLAFIAVLIALTIKMRKSPFDIAASEHAAHQELVRGVYTEYSGRYYALIEITYWYELVFVLAFIALFWAVPLWIGVLIALACYLLELFVDNISARLTWRWMLRISWIGGVVLVLVNMIPWAGGWW